MLFRNTLRDRIVTSYIHPGKRRIDDRINELCDRMHTAQSSDKELQDISRELLCLWHEKMNRVRNLAAAHLAGERMRKERRR